MKNRSTKGSKTRVLLVDDEPELTATLRVGLKRAKGWTVDEASSGEDALELLEANSYDVIVSDERMPGMQGSDLLTIARHRWPDTIRITLSGQASLERAIIAINSADVHRFLLKPCGRDEVAATIEELLVARRQMRASREQAALVDSTPRSRLESRFDDAMREVRLAYQPIFGVDGALFGHEALVQSSSSFFATPASLMAAANQLGRTRDLAETVRERTAEAVEQAPPGTAILLAVEQDVLLDERTYDAHAPLSKCSDRIILEIRKDDAEIEVNELNSRLGRLVDMGFRIAVDDLGAGQADLGGVTLLSPDFVQFDAAMVRSIDRSPTKAAVFSAMASLCQSLGIRSIARGIETPAELAKVCSLGCDYTQGFHLAAPAREFHTSRLGDVA